MKVSLTFTPITEAAFHTFFEGKLSLSPLQPHLYKKLISIDRIMEVINEALIQVGIQLNDVGIQLNDVGIQLKDVGIQLKDVEVQLLEKRGSEDKTALIEIHKILFERDKNLFEREKSLIEREENLLAQQNYLKKIEIEHLSLSKFTILFSQNPICLFKNIYYIHIIWALVFNLPLFLHFFVFLGMGKFNLTNPDKSRGEYICALSGSYLRIIFYLPYLVIFYFSPISFLIPLYLVLLNLYFNVMQNIYL